MKGFYRGFSVDLSCGQQEDLTKTSSQEENTQISEVHKSIRRSKEHKKKNLADVRDVLTSVTL